MIRWKAIGLLVLSVALVAGLCDPKPPALIVDDDADFILDNDAVFDLYEDGQSTDESDSSESDVSQDDDETTPVPPGSEGDTASSLGHNDDAVGDQHDMSDSTLVKEGEGEPGADVTHVEYFAGDEGVAYFDVDVAGDGQEAAAEAPNYHISVEAIDSEGEEWQARVEYRNGEPNSGAVWLGPKGPGQDTVEDGTVTVEWLDKDTVRLCVNGGAANLDVESFLIEILFFGTEGNFYDSAEGTVE